MERWFWAINGYMYIVSVWPYGVYSNPHYSTTETLRAELPLGRFGGVIFVRDGYRAED